LVSALARGGPSLTDVDRSAGQHGPGAARRAALVGPFDLGPFIAPLAARRMSPPSRWSVVAARTACDDAGIAPSDEPDPGIAVALATAFGPATFTQRLVDHLCYAARIPI
jgi:3-oxoacyl-(acyl-carrier-protein) synthase